MDRRTYLSAVAATLAAAGLAGCSEESDAGTGDADGGGSGSDGGSDGGGDADGGSGSDGGSDGGSDADGGSGSDGSGSGTDGGDQPTVEILSHEFYSEEFSSGVRGTLRNNTDSELSYVEVEAVFLDAEGVQIGDGIDNVTELAGGRTWEFDCMFLGDDPSRIDRYEIEASTGF